MIQNNNNDNQVKEAHNKEKLFETRDPWSIAIPIRSISTAKDWAKSHNLLPTNHNQPPLSPLSLSHSIDQRNVNKIQT